MADLIGFAENLKQIRKKRGFTQNELGKAIGVSAQTISAYEKGSGDKGKNPTLEKVIDIADTLGVSLDELCGRNLNTGNRVKTLGDAARLLCEMKDWNTVTFSKQKILRSTKNGMREYDDFPPAIAFDAGPLRDFLEAFEKLWQLYKEKTIDDKMFNDWISMKIESLDSVSATTQIPSYGDYTEIDDEDDELPF